MSKKPYRVISEKVVNPIFQEKPVGSYEVMFDASSLPSGIYFYKLKADDNIFTKNFYY
jgi:hypothetical protein